MYILFELSSSHYTQPASITRYDCMGYTTDEESAMEWVKKNEEYRTYKYCPDIKY